MIVALFFAALFFPAIDAREVCQDDFYIDEAIDMFSELIFLLGIYMFTNLCIYNGYCEKNDGYIYNNNNIIILYTLH